MYLGLDHSTTGVKIAMLDEDGPVDSFVVERSPDEDGDWSFIELLRSHVPLSKIDIAAIGYSYGDGITKIRDVSTIENRGIVDTLGLGHEYGTGTYIYDELVASDIPTVAFPGIHNGLETLHPYFTHYSPLAGADKTAMTRYAQEVLDEGENFIASCVSSSAIASVVIDGKLAGSFHWIALIHGWADVETIRCLNADEIELKDVFFESGLLKRRDDEFSDIKGIPDAELLEMLYYATIHNVHSLAPFVQDMSVDPLEGIVLSGRLSNIEEPVDMRGRFKNTFEELAPTHFCPSHSTAYGAAHIAKDVYHGSKTVLGIPVGPLPTHEVATFNG